MDNDNHSRIYVNQSTDDLDMQYGEINMIEFRFDQFEIDTTMEQAEQLDQTTTAAATTPTINARDVVDCQCKRCGSCSSNDYG